MAMANHSSAASRKQTIAWCSPRVDSSDPAASFRSGRLRPWVLASDRAATVRHVLIHRAGLDRTVGLAEPVSGIEDLGDGRLLAYFPDLNLFDGAAEDETRGFFDVENVPPWDTWTGLFHDDDGVGDLSVYLVSWVPLVFLETVQRGIDVTPRSASVGLRTPTLHLPDGWLLWGFFGSPSAIRA